MESDSAAEATETDTALEQPAQPIPHLVVVPDGYSPTKYVEKIPEVYRFGFYVFFSVGSIAMSYLTGKHVVGLDEAAAWNALGAFFSLLAAGNVSSRGQLT